MFVFYDTETTGLEQDFSQILQIALVFTDDDLNILSSKKLESRRSPWVVPAPGALLTTGFVPDDLKNNEYSHYEMMQKIYDWVRGQHWPLTFVGYNSMGYDEPVLAQNLYQNLLDPHLTLAGNGANDQSNGRADVMTGVKAVALYMPGVLKLDIMTPSGKNPSVSLKNVAQQNGVSLSDDDAHDAMNDIKATVGVAKLLKKAAPQIWEQLLSLSTSKGVDEFLAAHEVFTYATTSYGKSVASVVTALPEKENGVTQSLFDLSIDPTPYLSMTVEQLKNVFLSKDKQKPLVPLNKSNQPILMPMDQSEAVIPATYDEKLYADRAQMIKSNAVFLDNVAEASLLVQKEKVASAQKALPEMMIDQPVAAPVKQKIDQWMKEFRAASDWHKSAELIQDFYVRFKDDLVADPSLSRFVKFAGRIVYENAPQELSQEKRKAMKEHIAARLLNPDDKASYMTLAKARKELEQIEKERVGGKKWADVTDNQIRTLKLYYTSLEKEYAAFYTPPKPPVNDNGAAKPNASKKPDPQP
ncbi:MAG: hypothetical protein HY052_00940 [Proteobacteria bacterium]|nr:hypothetical protein [Pseudomonadota bacterium]